MYKRGETRKKGAKCQFQQSEPDYILFRCGATIFNAYMPNSTCWGYRWCRIAMRTCYSTLTMPLHCVNDLRTIQDGCLNNYVGIVSTYGKNK